MTDSITTPLPGDKIAQLKHDRWRHRLFLVGWSIALAVTMWSLMRLGQTSLAAPPIDSIGSLTEWVERVGTANAAFSFVRLLALALTAYLIVMTVVGLAARATRRDNLIELADVATIPALRRLLSGAAGIGLTISSLSMPLAPLVATLAVDQRAEQPLETIDNAPFAHPDGLLFDAPRLIELDDGTLSIAPQADDGVERHVDELDPRADRPDLRNDGPGRPGIDLPIIDLRSENQDAADFGQRPRGAAELLDDGDEAPIMRVRPRAVQAQARAWTAEPGDHLWTIAARTLDEAWGRKASDAEIAIYWIDIIAHNRVELADPENPDLVFPGQVFHLPAPPREPGDQNN